MGRKALLLAVVALATPAAQVQAQANPPAAAVQQKPVGALIVIDDIVIGNGFILALDARDLDALNVISYEIVKKDVAVRLYGDRARDGAVIIRTARPADAAAVVASAGAEWSALPPAVSQPFMVVDGVVLGRSSAANIDRFVDKDNIESIEVIKGAAAEAAYGSAAASGVITIKTKKKH